MRKLFKDGVYHRDVYFPKDLQVVICYLLSKPLYVKPSLHYYEKATKWKLSKGAYKTALHGEIIEAEINDGQVVKIVTRIQDKFAPKYSMCFAIQLEDLKGTEEKGTVVVKTVWRNCEDDNHSTLDRTKYLHKIQQNLLTNGKTYGKIRV